MSNEFKKYNITVSEAKEILNVARKTIYRWINSDKLRAKKINAGDTRKWFIHEDDIYEGKLINESIEIQEVNRNIKKEELMNELIEAIGERNEQAVASIKNTLDKQNELLAELLENHISQLQEENERLKQENQRLRGKLEEAKQKGLLGKVKGLFK